MHSLKCMKKITAVRKAVRASAAHMKKPTTLAPSLLFDKTRRCSSTDSKSGANFGALIPDHDNFAHRHIGPTKQQQHQMLAYLGVKVRQAVTNYHKIIRL